VRTWSELERDFRGAWDESGPYVRLDYQGAAGTNHWRIAASMSPQSTERFEALSRIAGEKLLQIPASADWADLVAEPNPTFRWYDALKKLTRAYRMSSPVFQVNDDGSEVFVEIGSIRDPGATSSALCVTLESLAFAAPARVEVLSAIPRYRGPWNHWQSAQSLLQSAEPDFAKASHEAVNAVEGMCRILLDNPSITLGDALKRMKSKQVLDSGLCKTIEGLWAFTSSQPGVRHGGATPASIEAHEAQFVADVAESALVLLLALDGVE